MRMNLNNPASQVSIVDSWDPGWNGAQRMTDPGEIRTLLNGLFGDPFSASQLRGLVAKIEGGLSPQMRTEREMIEAIASELVAGRLRVLRGQPMHEDLMPARRKPEGQAAGGPTGQRKPPPPGPSEPPPEEPLEQDEQAECLVDAAEEGAPLCQECEKKA
jgi:hypothetical protein